MADVAPESMSETLIFDALSDGVRRQILECLGDRGECSVTELSAYVQSVGRTAVSNHLRVLRTSGVVQERKDGRIRYYSLDREGTVSAAVQYLQRLLENGSRTIVADTVDTDIDVVVQPLRRLSS
ncbi:MAG: ArsR family transcriptional regulator [Rhodococcus erythropolis]|jgi:DNA-binding transcriptional ArsR family regulator|nr:ArsR family transcriptional regulator [Rhodococcus erythropolis]